MLGPLFSTCGPLLVEPGWSLKPTHSPGGPQPGEGLPAAESGEAMALGVIRTNGKPSTYGKPIKWKQTKHVKASANSLCNKYCKAHLVSFFLSFFQVKYNNQCPKPCFQHSKEKSCCYQHNTSGQSKKKTVSH